jgi:glutaminyl-peptide cyclotransferase
MTCRVVEPAPSIRGAAGAYNPRRPLRPSHSPERNFRVVIPIRRALRSAAPAAVLALFAACADRPPPPPEFHEARAWAHLGAQVAFGPRYAGHRGHARQVEWLREQLRFRADTVLLQPFTFPAEDGRTLRWTNVVARFRPAAAERVLLVAHFDTRRRSAGSADPEDRGRATPGANVNASGVAVLMELAQLLSQQPPRVGVDLLFADGDDYSDSTALAGTRHFLAAMPGYRARWAVVVCAVADYEPRFALDTAAASGPAGRLWTAARRTGDDTVFVAEGAVPRTGQAALLSAAGIPAVTIEDGEYGPLNARWHGVDDLPTYLKRETMGAVGRTLAAAIWAEPGDGKER